MDWRPLGLCVDLSVCRKYVLFGIFSNPRESKNVTVDTVDLRLRRRGDSERLNRGPFPTI